MGVGMKVYMITAIDVACPENGSFVPSVVFETEKDAEEYGKKFYKNEVSDFYVHEVKFVAKTAN
jgi:hypothetical protein